MDFHLHDDQHDVYSVSHVSYTIDNLSEFLREQSPLDEPSDFMHPSPDFMRQPSKETTATSGKTTSYLVTQPTNTGVKLKDQQQRITRKKRNFHEVQSETPTEDGSHDDTYAPKKKANVNATRKDRNKIAARKCRSTQQKYREDTDAWLTKLQAEVSALRSSLAATIRVQSALGSQILQDVHKEKPSLPVVLHGLDIQYVKAVSVFDGNTVSTGHNAVSERNRMW
jgi:hypothetical protein